MTSHIKLVFCKYMLRMRNMTGIIQKNQQPNDKRTFMYRRNGDGGTMNMMTMLSILLICIILVLVLVDLVRKKNSAFGHVHIKETSRISC